KEMQEDKENHARTDVTVTTPKGSINELLNSKRKPGRPKKIQSVDGIQKGTRTPTSLLHASIKSPNIVLSEPLMVLTLRPRERPRKSDISTRIVNANIETTTKGTFIAPNKTCSTFNSQTPIQTNLVLTSSKKDNLSHDQSSLVTSDMLKLRPRGRPRKRQNSTDTPLQSVTSLGSLCPKSTITNGLRFHKLTPVKFDLDYIDHGDPNFSCESCGALLWHSETLRGAANTSSASYSICCGRGKVTLGIELKEPPKLLKDLIKNEHPKSASFIDNIRRYNSMFAFNSMAGHQDTSVNVGRGPYCYRLHGENYHLAGSLLPKTGKPAKFAQLYIYDTENEITNKIKAVRFVNIANVERVDNLGFNLLSVSQICDNKCQVLFSKNGSEIIKNGKVIASKELVRNLPKLKFDQHLCDACKIGKQAHASHKAKNMVSTTRCLELLHMDLFSPSAVQSYGGNLYMDKIP
ncbi:reverse transcriptase domain-containing protein, partial [Tanacetum coccineum]